MLSLERTLLRPLKGGTGATQPTRGQDQRSRRTNLTTQQLFTSHEELTGGKGAKRMRRHANELDKQYTCPYPRCFKNYGAEIALNLHIKLKHNGGNKTERERAAVTYLLI
jgi:hypothetical protein